MKIGFFITARLKSSRLKHKILLDLNGKPIIHRIIERCKATPGIDGVVLCTSTNPQDSLLYDFAVKNDIQFWAGSEDDVLERLLAAAEYFGYDAFVSITADNPLFSIYTSQLLVDWNKRDNFDFIFTKGLPIGVGTYFINCKALKIANYMKKESNTEIWGPFVNRDDFFHIGELVVTNSPYKEERRITCDYPEDYALFQKIYSAYEYNTVPKVQMYLSFLKDNVTLWDINSMHKQLMPTVKALEDINSNFDSMINIGKDYAHEINHKLIPKKEIMRIEL
ncbi:MAG: NTP transferase domain-containing protein [Candidatus Cloacimonetes bacterium]|nr:NTP transferase domain-containing protein [Candidatus Cloacimonadota bacterium]